MRASFNLSISVVSSRFVRERGGPASLGLRRRIGDTGAVCSSVSAKSANKSGDFLGVLISAGFETSRAGRGCMGDGVGVLCARRASSALRRYSDLGATAEAVSALTMDGRLWFGGVDGRDLREDGGADILVCVLKVWAGDIRDTV
jgi:hypothetical protein